MISQMPNDVIGKINELFAEIDAEVQARKNPEQRENIKQQLIIEYRSLLKDILKDKDTKTLTDFDTDKKFKEICEKITKWDKKPGSITELRFKAIKLNQKLGLSLTKETRHHRETLIKWYHLY